MRFLGIDPGGTGALALLDDATGILEIEDMPVFRVPRGRSAKPEIAVWETYRLLLEWTPDICYFEQVGGMDGDSASSAFNFGRLAGAAEAVAKLSGASFHFVAPHVWKKRMGLRGGKEGKDECRARATNLWPANAADFRLKTRADRAEAALLAEYGRQQQTQGLFA